MTRAVLYARFSSDQQRDSSIEDQMRECAQVASANAVDVVARFEDRAISGGTTERPGYQAMLTAARAGSFDLIIAEDISRLWRSRAEFGARSAELEDLSVDLLTCVGDDTRREGWGLVISIKSALAEHARREISYRTRRALKGLALAGKPTGGRTYGYADPDTIDPAQAAVVRQIFERYLFGDTVAQVTAILNVRNIPAPRGGEWRTSTVHAILANPRYTGAVRWGMAMHKPSAVDSRRKRRIARPDEGISRDNGPVIVPAELWQAAAAERTRRAAIPVRRV